MTEGSAAQIAAAEAWKHAKAVSIGPDVVVNAEEAKAIDALLAAFPPAPTETELSELLADWHESAFESSENPKFSEQQWRTLVGLGDRMAKLLASALPPVRERSAAQEQP